MSGLVAALRRIVSDLEEAGKPWALVGGLAVSVRVEPRTTRDVDVAVAVAGDSEAEALVRGYDRGRDLANALDEAVQRYR